MIVHEFFISGVLMKKMMMLFMMLMPLNGWAAEWSLDAGQSELTIVSVKKGVVGEVHHFNKLHGSLNGGQAQVSVDLSSVETGVTVRNERMKTMLFDVSRFATATVSADVSSIKLAELKPGESVALTVPLTLSLHGIEQQLPAGVTVVGLIHGGLLVSSRAPVIVKAADFGLDAGIEALREVAKLPSIAHVVPVSFVLYFKQ